MTAVVIIHADVVEAPVIRDIVNETLGGGYRVEVSTDAGGLAPAEDAAALRRSAAFWGGYLWSLLADTNQPLTVEESERLADAAVEEYIQSCLGEPGAR